MNQVGIGEPTLKTRHAGAREELEMKSTPLKNPTVPAVVVEHDERPRVRRQKVAETLYYGSIKRVVGIKYRCMLGPSVDDTAGHDADISIVSQPPCRHARNFRIDLDADDFALYSTTQKEIDHSAFAAADVDDHVIVCDGYPAEHLGHGQVIRVGHGGGVSVGKPRGLTAAEESPPETYVPEQISQAGDVPLESHSCHCLDNATSRAKRFCASRRARNDIVTCAAADCALSSSGGVATVTRVGAATGP
jgi:hypothetical protein